MMLQWLSRCKGIQGQFINTCRRYLSSASSNEGPSGKQPSNQATNPFEKDEKTLKEILAASKKEADEKRRTYLEQEELSSYDHLKKMYLEQNMNRYDSQAAGQNLEDETPLERAIRSIKNDFKYHNFIKFFLPENMQNYGTSDFFIVGSGISASLLGYFLKSKVPRMQVTILEEDSLIACEPLGINGESLIMQWDMPHYIKMASFAFDFYRTLPYQIDKQKRSLNYTPYGSLLLSSSPEDLDGRCVIYNSIDWQYERLNATRLNQTFPWLNVDGLQEGIRGLRSEGWIDPWNALVYARHLAMTVGVTYMKGVIADIVFNQESGVETEDRCYGEIDIPRIAIVKLPNKRYETVDFTHIVLASGVRNKFNSMKLHIGNGPGYLRVPLPLKTRKRYMFRLRCLDSPVLDFPLIIDPSGFRIRREGYAGWYLCWRDPSKEEEPDPKDLNVDESYFEEKIRPALVSRIPAFKTAKVESCWAGLIDVNDYDGEPIIGLHPSYGNVFFITGLGSNEVIFSPAIAKASAELLLESDYKTIDCSAFLLDRILFNDPIIKRSGYRQTKSI